jgi:hypothetical protein
MVIGEQPHARPWLHDAGEHGAAGCLVEIRD